VFPTGAPIFEINSNWLNGRYLRGPRPQYSLTVLCHLYPSHFFGLLQGFTMGVMSGPAFWMGANIR
jgi:hypothetical protein